jgi:hypothetical protein
MNWLIDRLGEKKMFKLMVSDSDPKEKISYSLDSEAETRSELDARMDELDSEGKRWILIDEEDQHQFEYRICAIHKISLGEIISKNIRQIALSEEKS